MCARIGVDVAFYTFALFVLTDVTEEPGLGKGVGVAGVLGGALAPIISVALLNGFDTWVAVAVYVIAMLAITTVAVLVARETAAVDLAADNAEQAAAASTCGDRPPRLRPLFD